MRTSKRGRSYELIFSSTLAATGMVGFLINFGFICHKTGAGEKIHYEWFLATIALTAMVLSIVQFLKHFNQIGEPIKKLPRKKSFHITAIGECNGIIDIIFCNLNERGVVEHLFTQIAREDLPDNLPENPTELIITESGAKKIE